MQSIVPDFRAEICVVSPLTRAIQTACLAFEHEQVPLVISPLITEFFGDEYSCQGRNQCDLLGCELLSTLPRKSSLDFAHLRDNWWDISQKNQRLASFLRWASYTHEKRIAAVCHWGFIRYLLNNAGFHDELVVCFGSCLYANAIIPRVSSLDRQLHVYRNYLGVR